MMAIATSSSTSVKPWGPRRRPGRDTQQTNVEIMNLTSAEKTSRNHPTSRQPSAERSCRNPGRSPARRRTAKRKPAKNRQAASQRLRHPRRRPDRRQKHPPVHRLSRAEDADGVDERLPPFIRRGRKTKRFLGQELAGGAIPSRRGPRRHPANLWLGTSAGRTTGVMRRRGTAAALPILRRTMEMEPVGSQDRHQIHGSDPNPDSGQLGCHRRAIPATKFPPQHRGPSAAAAWRRRPRCRGPIVSPFVPLWVRRIIRLGATRGSSPGPGELAHKCRRTAPVSALVAMAAYRAK